MAGILLLAGIVLGVVGAMLSGRATVPRWARVLIVLAVVLFCALALGDLIGAFLGYPNIYSSVRDTGYFGNRYVTKMAALSLALCLYVSLGFASRFFLRLKWRKAVGCIAVWLFLYYGAMAFMTNGQVFNTTGGNERVYVRLPVTEQFPKGEILLMDKELKQDRYYGIEAKKPDAEVMKEYYDQHPDERPGRAVKKQVAPAPPAQPQPQSQLQKQPMKEAGNPSPAPSSASSQPQSQSAWAQRWARVDTIENAVVNVVGETLGSLLMIFLCLMFFWGLWGSISDRAKAKKMFFNYTDTGWRTIEATTTPFVACDHFIVNESENAPVRIYSLGRNFKEWFLDKVEEPFEGSTLNYGGLYHKATDEVIVATLGGEKNAETTLTEMFTLLKAQGNGRSGPLITAEGGGINIFYVRDVNKALRTIRVHWTSRGWYLRPSLIIEVLHPRNAGARIFFRLRST
ncbi:MAG: hypothetical protein P4M11_07935 [Candidatus Pacebacteria bacterium]|nr:hypothetical protein [Candidatus Paceibacterota bacterium]